MVKHKKAEPVKTKEQEVKVVARNNRVVVIVILVITFLMMCGFCSLCGGLFFFANS